MLREILPPGNGELHRKSGLARHPENRLLLRFPKELRPDTLKDNWEGPFSKYEMAEFCFDELKKKFPDRISEVQSRIEM